MNPWFPSRQINSTLNNLPLFDNIIDYLGQKRYGFPSSSIIGLILQIDGQRNPGNFQFSSGESLSVSL